jgi:hypothetical protein
VGGVSEPQIIMGGTEGFHNGDGEASRQRLKKGRTYEDLSTVCIIPTRGSIDARVVESWWGLMTPMNQQFTRMIVKNMEVGDAYNTAIAAILEHPVLSQWRYVLTLEEDNMPPPDGLLKLYESIKDYDAVGGLYWTKGEGGQPMCYGHPQGILNFIPQLPEPETVQECNGLGMGFTLFRLGVFRELEPPWFKTVQEYTPEAGTKMYTQDLYFFEQARRAGKRVACDTRVRVGHYDATSDIIW